MKRPTHKHHKKHKLQPFFSTEKFNASVTLDKHVWDKHLPFTTMGSVYRSPINILNVMHLSKWPNKNNNSLQVRL